MSRGSNYAFTVRECFATYFNEDYNNFMRVQYGENLTSFEDDAVFTNNY